MPTSQEQESELEEVKVEVEETSTLLGDEEAAVSKKREEKVEEEEPKAKGGDPPTVTAPAAPEFKFLPLLKEVMGNARSLDAYTVFVTKFAVLEAIRMLGTFSLVIYAYAVHDQFTTADGKFTTENYIAFAFIGVLNIVSRIIPLFNLLLIDKLKMQLQVSQATSLIDKIFTLEHNAMIGTPTGEFSQLLAKVYMNVDKLLPAFYGTVCPMVVETLIALVFFGVAFGWIAVVQAFMFIVYSMASYHAAKKTAKRNEEMMMVMFSEWSKLLDTANSYERAHFFDNVEFEVEKSRDAFTYMGSRMLAVTSGAYYSKAVLTLISLVITGGFVALLVLVVDGLTTLELGALIFYYFMFVARLDEYSLAVTELRTGLVEYQALDNFTERMSGVKDVPGAVELVRNKNPIIEFKNVTFSYGGKVILDDISFRIEGGQTLGMVGSSGCGKSTIMRLLLRFYRPSEGTIYVDGHDISQVTGRSLRLLFSVVTQDCQLFNSSIRDNIAYGKRGSSDDEIVQAASLAELSIGKDDLTLDKVIGEKGAKLSGGQQQRVAIARAMLKNGTIYLLDEPTTGLDRIVAKQLQATLDGLSTHSTTITITHHLDDLKNAHQILYLEDGKIVERGTYKGLLEQGGAFFKQTQARAEESSSPI